MYLSETICRFDRAQRRREERQNEPTGKKGGGGEGEKKGDGEERFKIRRLYFLRDRP